MPREFIANRDVRLSSLTGHIVNFKKDTPIQIPESIVSEALAIGIVEVGTGVPKDKPIIEGDVREAAIEDAIRQLIALNNESNFTRDGTPKVKSVSELTGFDVTKEEVTTAFEGLVAGNE